AEHVADPRERALMEKLVARGVGRPQPKETVAAEGPLVGTSFCVTGVLSRKREVVHALLRAAGAVVHDSVKKGTTYLVAGEKTGKTMSVLLRLNGAGACPEAVVDRPLAGEEL